ncbi:MAG: HEAT repeat domain-containing protein [Dissulfuribacterales bacterium]
MKRYFYPAAVLIIGLGTAQLLFSFLVYLSDISLFHHLLAIKQAGFLTVPNDHVMMTLQNLAPAFYGAFFFTLTTGAGLTVTAFWLVFGWHRFFNQNRYIFICILIFWIFILYKLNSHGLNLVVSLAFIIIPAAVGLITIMLYSHHSARLNPLNIITHIIVVILIGAAWAPKLNSDVFITIRDHLLLTHPLGKKINTFYYKYTLYPAETFKSLNQKLLKTCRVKINDPDLYQKVTTKLNHQDYLTVDESSSVDLTIYQKSGLLIFKHHETLMHECTHKCSIDTFLDAPKQQLKLFSEKCDKNIFFRQITFISLIFFSPLLCYLFLYFIIMLSLFFVRPPVIRSVCASVLCLTIGIVLVLPLYQIHTTRMETQTEPEILKNLQSADWHDRVFALKVLSDKNLSVKQSDIMQKLVKSPFIPERYWMAKTLGNSDSAESYKILLEFLSDKSPNVVCMALYSLGRKNRPLTFQKIIDLISSSKHWYVQWYAYKSLKRLGWTQSK